MVVTLPGLRRKAGLKQSLYDGLYYGRVYFFKLSSNRSDDAKGPKSFDPTPSRIGPRRAVSLIWAIKDLHLPAQRGRGY